MGSTAEDSNYYSDFFRQLWESIEKGMPSSLERAKKAQQNQQMDDAERLYRRAIREDAADDRACLEYARFLISQSRGRASEEFLVEALRRNPCNHDALELYLEVQRTQGLGKEQARWAFSALATALPKHPQQHRGALDYVISEKLDQGYEALRNSPDPVVRAAMRLNDIWIVDPAASDELVDSALEGLSTNDADRARTITMLGRGKVTGAVHLLRSMAPAAVPIDSLRRAVRRAIYRDQVQRAITFLEILSLYRPQDSWVQNKLTEFTSQPFSNAVLRNEGFPLPEVATSAAYAPCAHKVFYLLHNSLPYSSAGYATRTHGLLHSLNQLGWDVDGVTRLGYPYDRPETGIKSGQVIPDHDEIDGVDYYRLNRGTDRVPKHPLYYYVQDYSAKLAQLAKVERPQIIHAASNHWNGLTAVKTARELGIPSVYEVRGLWEVTRGSREPQWWGGPQYNFMAQMEAEAAQGATAVITITGALRDEMISRGVPAEKIMVVPNGVDTARFQPMRRDRALLRQLGVEGKTVIGYVGSILDYEGIDLLIEATRILATVRDDFHVLIVGDGAKRAELQHYVEQMGFGTHITFTGRIPHEEVERYYSIIDITPLPRHPLPVCEMVSPLKPFEAMAMGKTIVGSDVDAIREIIIPGTNGFLHRKGDVNSLVAQLRKLLDSNRRIKVVGKSARRWVVEHRDWSRLGAKIANLYESLV